MPGLRRRVFLQLDLHTTPGSDLSLLNKAIVILILISVAYVVLSTEPTLVARWPDAFLVLDVTFGALFTIEYAARVWSVGERAEYRGVGGRLRYMRTPRALIDLAAILPFYLALGMTESFLLRLFRLLRIVSLAKLGRYTAALHTLKTAISERRHELHISLGAAMIVLLASGTLLYIFEGAAQPEEFGSIPRALWWGVATLTTVGYGDVYPMTVLGRLFAGVSALAAVGMVAMPAGILAAAFSEAFQQKRRREGTLPSDRGKAQAEVAYACAGRMLSGAASRTLSSSLRWNTT